MTFAGSAGTRERGKGRPESARRTGEEGVCDHARRPTGVQGRLPIGEAAENDVSSRTMMTRRFPRAGFPYNVAGSRESGLGWVENRQQKCVFKSHCKSCCEATTRSRTRRVGVSSDRGVARIGDPGKQDERSKGDSSDMPPRGMSAEVRARKSSFREVPRFGLRLRTCATRGARDPAGARLADRMCLPSLPLSSPRLPSATSEPRRTSASRS